MDANQLKKLKRGELAGVAATGFCGAVLVYFIIGFSVALSRKDTFLKILFSASAGGLMAAGIAVAAFCSLYYAARLDKAIDKFVLDVFVSNAAKLHPERDSLTFYIRYDGQTLSIKINGFKDEIVFDFGWYGKLSAMRKMTLFSSVETRLTCSFLRMFERGGKYKDVCYVITGGARRKKDKPIYIINNGSPDKRALKLYLKNS